MKVRGARIAVLFMAVGLLAFGVSPARATTSRGVTVFSGELQQSAALANFSPTTRACLTGGNPMNCGNTVGFLFSSAVCLDVDAPGKGDPLPGACSLSMAGTLTGLSTAATGTAAVFLVVDGGGSFSTTVDILLAGAVLSLTSVPGAPSFGATIVLTPEETPPAEEDPPPPPPRQGGGLSGRSG